MSEHEPIDPEFAKTPEFTRFDRSLSAYRVNLFRDDLPAEAHGSGALDRPITELYVPVRGERVANEQNESSLGAIYGGWDEFFKNGSTIIDLGSGSGRAVYEAASLYPECRVVGIDRSYLDHKPDYAPANNLSYVAADWNKIPFQEDTFDRILSLHAFPRHPGLAGEADPEELEKFARDTIEEITKTAKIGTIWRGSLWGQRDHRVAWNSETVIPILSEFGWEVYYLKSFESIAFVAKLVEKKQD